MSSARVGIILDGDARGAVDAGEDAAKALRDVAVAADEAAADAVKAAGEIAAELDDTTKSAARTAATIVLVGDDSSDAAKQMQELVAAMAAAQREANDLTRQQIAMADAQERARIAAAALVRAEREQAQVARDAARAAREVANAERDQARATEQATREAERQREALTGMLTQGALRAAALVVGVEALKRAFGALSNEVRAYYERSEELTAQQQALAASTDTLRDSLLGTIITVENSEVVLGALQTAAQRVSDELQGTALSSDTARTAVATLLRVMAAGVSVMRGLHSGFVAVRLALIAGEAAQYAWGAGIVRVGATVAEFVTGALAGMIQGLTDLARVALPASDLLGEGVGGALRGIVDQGDATAASLRGTRDNLAAMGDELRDQTARAMAEYRAEADRAIEQATVLDAALESVRDTLREVANDAENGRTSLELLAGATAEGGASAAIAAEQYDKLKDALDAYIIAKHAQLAVEAQIAESAFAAMEETRVAAELEKLKGEFLERQTLAAASQEELNRIAVEGAEARLRLEEDATRAYADAQTRRAQILSSATGKIIAGQESAADAFRAILGNELGALADQYAAIAVARFLALDFIGGAGYAAGAASLSVAAAALGGSSSGSGGVASAAPQQTVIQESRTDIRINASGIINDEVVSQIAMGVGEASRRGML